MDIHRKIADFIDDEHSVLGQNLELVRQTVLKMSLFQLLNKLVAVDVVGGEPVLSRHKAQGGGQMSLAHTWWSKEYHVLPVLQETHGGQFVDLAFVDGWLEREIEVVQGLLNGKARHLDLLLIGSFPLGFGFFREDVIQNFHNVEVLRHGPFQVIVQNLQGSPGCFSFSRLPDFPAACP